MQLKAMISRLSYSAYKSSSSIAKLPLNFFGAVVGPEATRYNKDTENRAMEQDDDRVHAVFLSPFPYQPKVGGDEKNAPNATPKSKKARHEAAQIAAERPYLITVQRMGEESRQVRFRMDPSAFSSLTDLEREAFAAGDFDKISTSDSRLKNVLDSIAGRRRPMNLTHLGDADLEFILMDRKHFLGVGRHDTMFFRSFDPTSIRMYHDYAKGSFTGYQVPVISARANDIIPLNYQGLILVGPEYIWRNQKLGFVPDDTRKLLIGELPLPGHYDDGTKFGDVLNIMCDGDGPNSNDAPLEIVTGFFVDHDDIVLAGKDQTPVRVGMGVSFGQDDRDHGAIWFGNPSLKALHGLVESIQRRDGEAWLTVRVGLTRQNLPPFLGFAGFSHDALLQTDLRISVRAECVVTTLNIVPLPLHNCPQPSSRDTWKLGNTAQPLRQNAYVAGHMDFDLGLFRRADGSLSGDRREKSTNTNHKALELLSYWCARGGPITDREFSLHSDWKNSFMERSYGRSGGVFLPTATLRAVQLFPPEQALAIIANASRMFGGTGLDTQLVVLRDALHRFVEAKAKRTKIRAGRGSSISFNPNMSGLVLFQLLQKYGSERDFTTEFREGAVVVTVKNIGDVTVTAILGIDGGRFRLEGGKGIIQLLGPVGFKNTLYNPKTKWQESGEGSAEITFGGYLSKDRHGGELTGALYYEGDGGDGAGRKHKLGIWPERSVSYRRRAVKSRLTHSCGGRRRGQWPLGFLRRREGCRRRGRTWSIRLSQQASLRGCQTAGGRAGPCTVQIKKPQHRYPKSGPSAQYGTAKVLCSHAADSVCGGRRQHRRRRRNGIWRCRWQQGHATGRSESSRLCASFFTVSQGRLRLLVV